MYSFGKKLLYLNYILSKLFELQYTEYSRTPHIPPSAQCMRMFIFNVFLNYSTVA